MGTKRDKLSVDYMYSSKIFLHKNKVIFKNPPPPPFFMTIYVIKYAPHKQTIQIKTNNNRKEDTDM